MMNHITTCCVAAIAIGLAATACSPVTNEAGANTTTTTAPPATSATSSTSATSATSATAAAGDASLTSLLPTPANVEQSKGPDDIADGGIHLHYQVNGAPNEVMAGYKSALEGKGWALTTIISSSGGGGGGATYTGTHGNAYGVFDGGGYDNSTYIDVCTWSAKPANPNCSRGDR